MGQTCGRTQQHRRGSEVVCTTIEAVLRMAAVGSGGGEMPGHVFPLSNVMCRNPGPLGRVKLCRPQQDGAQGGCHAKLGLCAKLYEGPKDCGATHQPLLQCQPWPSSRPREQQSGMRHRGRRHGSGGRGHYGRAGRRRSRRRLQAAG